MPIYCGFQSRILSSFSIESKYSLYTSLFLTLSAPAQTPAAPASIGSPASHQPIQLSDLQNILATMNVPAAAAAAQGSAGE